MAKIQIRTDAGAIVASRDIPDGTLPKAQAIFGGATNQETALNVLRSIWKDYLRPSLKNYEVTAAKNTKLAEVDAVATATADQFDIDIPEGA